MLNEFTSGGASVNDAFFHGSLSTLPFGGVGSSGTGSYHGKSSFEAFTHRRSTTTTPGWMESLIAVRYPPYEGKLKRLRMTSEVKPNFDREGREIKGAGYWVKYIFTLGAPSVKRSILRWAVLALVVWGWKKRTEANSSLPSWLR